MSLIVTTIILHEIFVLLFQVIKLQAKQSKYKSKDDSEDEEYCTKTTRRTRKKLVDENTYPNLQTSSERR